MVENPQREPLPPDKCQHSDFWLSALLGQKPPIHSEPQPGLYRRKFIRGGPWVPVRIWIEQEIGADGELLNPPVVRCTVNGHDRGPLDEWLYACAEPIGPKEYEFLMARGKWATRHAPDDPQAEPSKRIDLSKAKPPF